MKTVDEAAASASAPRTAEAESPERVAVGLGPPGRGRSSWGWLLRLALGAGILAYLFTFIPVSNVVAVLSSAAPGWIGVALGLVAVERLTAAFRVTILSDQAGMGLSVWQNLQISISATFYGMFLPGELAGGAVRWHKMARPSGMRAEAAAVLSFDRLIDTIVLVLTGLAFWLLEQPSISSGAIQAGLLMLLCVLLVTLCLSLSRRAASLLLIPLARLTNRLRLGFVYNRVDKVLAAVRSFAGLSTRAVAALIAVSALRQLLAIGILFGFAAALGADVGFITFGWIRTFMNIAVMLPVSVSGLGVREGTLVLLLQPYGVAGSLAVALSLLMLFSHVLVAVGGGLLELKRVLLGREPLGPEQTRREEPLHEQRGRAPF